MVILLTGNCSLVSKELLSHLAETHKCVIYDERANAEAGKLKNVTFYERDNYSVDEMKKLFNTFNFDAVVYFSYTINGAIKVFDELEKFESTLYECRFFGVKNVVYVTSNDLDGETDNDVRRLSRRVLMTSCMDLCQDYAAQKTMHFSIIKVPFFYSLTNPNTALYQWIDSALSEGSVAIRGPKEKKCDFVNDEDFCELLLRVLDEPNAPYFQELQITGGNEFVLNELEPLLKKVAPRADIIFKNDDLNIPNSINNGQARENFGWFPTHTLEKDIPLIADCITKLAENRKKEEKRKQKQTKWVTFARKVLELVFLFLVAEVLTFYTKDNVLLNGFDFRLVFVVIIGTVNGMSFGILAAIMACISYLVTKSSDTYWQTIFYNVETWLPFACYMLLGSLSGYRSDKSRDDIKYVTDEKEILEKKYVFLSNLYNQAVDSKNRFNNQIIGYKDSYGKIYSAVERLNTLSSDRVFFEAVEVMEEFMENQTVAIYTIQENAPYARLVVCSKNVYDNLGRSIFLEEFPVLREVLERKEVFVNTEGLAHYPQYAQPIVQDDRLAGMILLVGAREDQMNMEYSNKFSIITDLIRDSLVRAIEAEMHSDQYIDGTRILKQEQFASVLAIRDEIQSRQYSEYQLLRINRDQRSIEQLGRELELVVRNNDILGIGEDGELYLMLAQTRESELSHISERFAKFNLSYSVVK